MGGNECFFPLAKYSSDFNTQLLLDLRRHIDSPEFKNKHRLSDNALVRNRKLPFSLLVLFLANFIKGSLQDELDGYNSCLVKELHKSGMPQIDTTLRPPSRLNAQVRATLRALPVRVLTYHPGGKEPIYLATSLLKEPEVSLAVLAWLYHQRWQIEESYRIKKCRLQIEEFSSESGDLILQDFHAKVFAEALTCALSVDLDDAITDYSQGKNTAISFR